MKPPALKKFLLHSVAFALPGHLKFTNSFCLFYTAFQKISNNISHAAVFNLALIEAGSPSKVVKLLGTCRQWIIRQMALTPSVLASISFQITGKRQAEIKSEFTRVVNSDVPILF